MILINMQQTIQSYIHAECPWRDTLLWFPTIDSTNVQAMKLAGDGAPHGTVLIAAHQTQGRGRLGRSFQSPEGSGVYLSVILRPDYPPEQLMHLTCAAGVAMVEAVEKVSGIRPQLKWINDLVIGNKKLGGILTQMSVDNGVVRYAVIGIGINCLQQEGDFPPEIQEIATSLSIAAGYRIPPEALAGAMVEALEKMSNRLFSEKKQIMDAYRRSCITLGKHIQVLRNGQVLPGTAIDLDNDGGLLVQYPDGMCETVSSGEVSVRGMYGYV